MSLDSFGFDIPKNVKFLCLRYGISIGKHNVKESFIRLLKAAAAAHDESTFELALYWMLTRTVEAVPFYIRFYPPDSLLLTFGIIDLQEQADRRCEYVRRILLPPQQEVDSIYVIYFVTVDADITILEELHAAVEKGRDIFKICTFYMYRLTYDGANFMLSPLSRDRKRVVLEQYGDDLLNDIISKIPLTYAKYRAYSIASEREVPATTREVVRKLRQEREEEGEESSLEEELEEAIEG